MSRFNPLSSAIRFALVTSAASLFATSAFAQDQGAADEDQVMETLEITGSRIQSQAVTSSSPVVEIQREEFQFSGATRVEDLVNSFPQLSPSFDSFDNNPNVGYGTIDLRSLGAQRTLTLVNGQRLPPGPTAELRDISIIPAALVSRVDILTGGASAVYGSDAVAGVVNFILDTEFEGFSITAGYSAYQHDNDNQYMQDLQTQSGFPFEDGNSGFDGVSRSMDIAMGSSFADGAGHAMAWLTYRKNEAMFHGQRDYASCALFDEGDGCGGSGTNASGNFVFFQGSNVGLATRTGSGFAAGFGTPYNYAPPNFYQRPDERYTFGTSIKYDVNEYFQPYLETMFVNRSDSFQIAESGAFGTLLSGLSCSNPILGTFCGDLGLDPTVPINVQVLRRNIEGGPRLQNTEDSTFRFVLGSKGSINENWSYNASLLHARTANDTQGFNDFLTTRIRDGLLGCPAGSFVGCLPYNVFTGTVTQEAANALAGVSFNKTSTELTSFNGFVTGDLGFGFASAGGENVSLVAGVESRRETYDQVSDSNSAAGNFAGAGAAAPPVSGETKVKEIFLEAALPIYAGDGFIEKFGMELGYRLSDYDLSGNANTYKIGFSVDTEFVKFRGGFNRAIRAPGINDLFAQQRTVLFGGQDPCAGLISQGQTPTFSAAQCANTGVSAAQYGNIPLNPASQNNQFVGGNPNLKPEDAKTYTVGFVVTPIENLALTLDYYDIKIEDTISGIGATTILEFCANTADPFLCNLIQRGPAGDLWLDDNNYVINTTNNFGTLEVRGLDFGATYSFEALGGRMAASFQGTYTMEYEQDPLNGLNPAAVFDCAGRVNPSCGSLQDWRHIASLRYSRDAYTASVRWRHFGSLDYIDNAGDPLDTDLLLAERGGVGTYNFIDLAGSASIGQNIELTLGINNIFDKEPPLVGATQANNANTLGGYDQAGRYFFSNISLKF